MLLPALFPNDTMSIFKGERSGAQMRHYLLFCPLALLALFGSYLDVSVSSEQIASFPTLTHWVARLTSLAVYAAAVPILCSGRSLIARPDGRTAAPWISCACLGVGMVTTLYASGSLPVFVIAQMLVGFGQALNLTMWAEMLCEAPRNLRWRLAILGGALGCTVSFVFKILGDTGSRVIMLGLTAGCCLLPLLVRDKKTPGNGSASLAATASRRLVRACFDRVSWGLCLLMGCYAMLFRIMGGLDGNVTVGISQLRFAVTLAGFVAMWAYFSRREATRTGRMPSCSRCSSSWSWP